jgi:uncharacterized membrane protein (UPF0127 family)
MLVFYLGEQMKECNTFFTRFRGLMFSKPDNLIFDLKRETRLGASIHTMFVFFRINVYWLDANKKVVYTCLNLRPFTFKIPKKKARYIIELKKGIYLDNPLIPSMTTNPPSIHAK